MKDIANGTIQRFLIRTAVACAVLVAAASLTRSDAQTYTVLYNFDGTNEGSPGSAGVSLDAAGNLYGATSAGGSSSLGIVFKLDTAGNATVLHSFTGYPLDGARPSGVILDPSGNLYGMTRQAGTNGNGVAYKLSASGKMTVLHGFTGGTDGGQPWAGLIRDPSGNLYGTTYVGGGGGGGGSGDCAISGCGAVFKLSPGGKVTTLHGFSANASDGRNPTGGLLRDAAGNLYGTTWGGGAYGGGTVFKLDICGRETILHSFSGCSGIGGPDGCNPNGDLAQDIAGNLFGTTYSGGSFGYGVVFKLDASGYETVLHSFAADPDGAYPEAGLVRDAAGNLYGTTYGGGSFYGTVFKIDPTGAETVLHAFSYADGAQPHATLLLFGNSLYGTANGGGTNAGVIFKIALGP